jgi:flagellar biogenesis protein FliO
MYVPTTATTAAALILLIALVALVVWARVRLNRSVADRRRVESQIALVDLASTSARVSLRLKLNGLGS